MFESPEFWISGPPERNVTRFAKPEALMTSAASTVTVFLTPDTVTLRHWPVSTTVLLTPLMLTRLSLQAMVLLSPTPETLMSPPVGAAVTVEAAVGAVAWLSPDG